MLLSSAGNPVFQMKGEDFSEMGADFGRGENPVHMVCTLPEKLYRLNGEPAFGAWEGGWIGVMMKQLEDANEAARQWVTGETGTK